MVDAVVTATDYIERRNRRPISTLPQWISFDFEGGFFNKDTRTKSLYFHLFFFLIKKKKTAERRGESLRG
jgi:hypothetical protein